MCASVTQFCLYLAICYITVRVNAQCSCNFNHRRDISSTSESLKTGTLNRMRDSIPDLCVCMQLLALVSRNVDRKRDYTVNCFVDIPLPRKIPPLPSD